MESSLRKDHAAIEYCDIFEALSKGHRVQTFFWKGQADNPPGPTQIGIPDWTTGHVLVHITSGPDMTTGNFSRLIAAFAELEADVMVGFTTDNRFPEGNTELRVIYVEGEPSGERSNLWEAIRKEDQA